MEQYLEFASNHILLVGSFFIVAGLIMANEFSLATRGFRDITPAEATRLLNHEDALMLDVRTVNEFRDRHIIGCTHIPLNELGSRLGELEKHRNSHVIAYCRSGNRSVTACKTLHKAGFEHVHNLGGGILAWENANLPTTRN